MSTKRDSLLSLQGETFLDGRVTLHPGDCLEVMPKLAENTFDSCICDPPYHLQSIVKRFAKTGRTDKTRTTSGPHQRTANGFMNKVWDGGDIAFQVSTWEKVFRVLKPGAYIVAFSSSRTFGRMSVAIEDAGFITLPLTGWIFGSGFPKAHRLDEKQICQCKPSSKHHMRDLRYADISTSVADREVGGEAVLFDGVSKQSLSPKGDAPGRRPEGAPQLRLEGRSDLQETSRKLCEREICSVPTGTHFNGPDGRLCDGASFGDGAMGRATSDPGGMRSPQGPCTPEQPEIELGTLAGQSESQDGGAWPLCDGCGKPIVPSGLRYGGQVTKPALEPIYIGQKPFSEKTGTLNVLRWGCGAMNVDGCRVFADDALGYEYTVKRTNPGAQQNKTGKYKQDDILFTGKTQDGRWPANVMTDGSPEVFASFPDSDGQLADISLDAPSAKTGNIYGKMNRHGEKSADNRYHDRGSTDFAALPGMRRNDSGSAARFFWSSKAGHDDRLGSNHPTVKPVDLIQELCRLYNPPGALVLDPFAGTGTTAEACFREGMRCCLVEREAEYQADIRRRIGLLLAGPDERRRESIKAKTKDKPIDAGPLFGGGDL